MAQKIDIVEFIRDVKDIVNAIPEGKVLSYGDVAALSGRPANARLVGKILAGIGMDSLVPCHRVVNAAGRPAPHWLSQRQLLRDEGVEFLPGGNVDMRRFRWDINEILPI